MSRELDAVFVKICRKYVRKSCEDGFLYELRRKSRKPPAYARYGNTQHSPEKTVLDMFPIVGGILIIHILTFQVYYTLRCFKIATAILKQPASRGTAAEPPAQPFIQPAQAEDLQPPQAALQTIVLFAIAGSILY